MSPEGSIAQPTTLLPMTNVEGEEREFQFLLDKIHRNTGMDFTLYRTGTLKRRIAHRMRATASAGASDYIIHLNRNPKEYDLLLDAITINVTEFFRDPETFQLLEKRVIPEIIKRKEAQSRKIIRVWSAATANGEECYSLAILFLEALRKRNSAARSADFHLRIYGTDIDPQCLESAQKGVYEAVELLNTIQKLVGK